MSLSSPVFGRAEFMRLHDEVIFPAPPDRPLRWLNLAALALRGLRAIYGHGPRSLPHTVHLKGEQSRPSGRNIRYALISILGLARARNLGLHVHGLVDDIWRRVTPELGRSVRSPGDFGLALWAQAVTGSRLRMPPAAAFDSFQQHRKDLDSVQLAWVMLGTDHHLMIDSSCANAAELNRQAKEDLLSLYNPGSNLMYRHSNRGWFAGVSRCVPCFANQIYPVMALAVHARRTGCRRSAVVGRAVAEKLCQVQGPLGQWWWLYDADRGDVVDGYPVFSVHQDGMAPMALAETTASGGRSFEPEIARGLAWICGNNEMGENLVMEAPGLILRDIHRKGVGRLRRGMHALACHRGWRTLRHAPAPSRLAVNRECRPYHLGWLLYAAANLAKVENTGSLPAFARAAH